MFSGTRHVAYRRVSGPHCLFRRNKFNLCASRNPTILPKRDDFIWRAFGASKSDSFPKHRKHGPRAAIASRDLMQEHEDDTTYDPTITFRFEAEQPQTEFLSRDYFSVECIFAAFYMCAREHVPSWPCSSCLSHRTGHSRNGTATSSFGAHRSTRKGPENYVS